MASKILKVYALNLYHKYGELMCDTVAPLDVLQAPLPQVHAV